MGPKARLWLSRATRTSSCSSEQESLSWPSQSTALLRPPGGERRDRGHQSHQTSKTPECLKRDFKVSGDAPVTGSPELHSVKQVHLCRFGPAHNVAHRHQRAGVQLARALLGGIQHRGEERGELGDDEISGARSEGGL